MAVKKKKKIRKAPIKNRGSSIAVGTKKQVVKKAVSLRRKKNIKQKKVSARGGSAFGGKRRKKNQDENPGIIFDSEIGNTDALFVATPNDNQQPENKNIILEDNVRRLNLPERPEKKSIWQKIFSFKNNFLSIFVALIFAALFCTTVYVLASPPSSPYNPGETLAPTCAPTDTNCTVVAPMTNPMTTLGDIIYENVTPVAARLAGNTTTLNKFLTQTGTGAVSAIPAWFDLFGTANTFTAKQTIQLATEQARLAYDASNYASFTVDSSGNLTIGQTSSANKFSVGYGVGSASYSNFLGYQAGNAATNASYSNFLGQLAGNGASAADHSNFLGQEAGNNATNANSSNFLGNGAGKNATNASLSQFIGTNAGIGATNAHHSNFIGQEAGNSAANANSSNFLGNGAGKNATNATLSQFIGTDAGNGATNASRSNFLGNNAGLNATAATDSNFFGQNAGNGATNAGDSIFIGASAGSGAANAGNSMFIGKSSGLNDTVSNTGPGAGTSIAIGFYSGTGGYSNSIALGHGVKNSAVNQLNIGNVIYATGLYNSDTPSSTPITTGSYTLPSLGTSAGFVKASNTGLLSVDTNTYLTSSTGVSSITGTANQVIASASTGAITLSTPQDIATSSTPQFARMGLGVAAHASVPLYILKTTEQARLAYDASNYASFTMSSTGKLTIGLTGSSSTIAIGNGAGSSQSSTQGVFIGTNAGANATSASTSVFLGSNAGVNALNATNAIFIGAYAGSTDGVDNTASGTSIAIGNYSGTGNFKDSIALGHGVKNSAVNQINIGNVIYATALYASDTPSSTPITTGSYTLPGFTSAGFVKTSAAGLLSVDTNTYLTSSSGVSSITGTANQVIASASTGAVTLSTPQNIGTSSTPQFARLGLNQAADATASLAATQTALATTSTDGIILQNTTAATVGVPAQYSPRIRLRGTAWKSAATAASQTQDWIIENQPVTGVNSTSSQFVVLGNNNGGGYTKYLVIDNNALQSISLGENAGRALAGGNQQLGSSSFGYNAGYLSAATYSTFIGYAAGYLIAAGSSANYATVIGYNAGINSSTYNQDNVIYIGNSAGSGITGAMTNTIAIGYQAGQGSTGALSAIFLGYQAGFGNLADYDTFIGYQAGYQVNKGYGAFIGYQAGYLATNAASANFFGSSAGSGATNAKNAIFIGNSSGLNDIVNNTTSGTSIAIGNFSGTGSFKDSIALGHGVINSAAKQVNIGNVLYLGGIYASDTQSSAQQSTGTVTIGGLYGTAGIGHGIQITSAGLLVDSSASSLRYKTNIQPLADDFSQILKAQPKSFNFKNNGQAAIGYIAEDFSDLGLKDLITYDDQGLPDAINYDRIPLYILEVVKQQQVDLNLLKATAGLSDIGTFASGNVNSTIFTNPFYTAVAQLLTNVGITVINGVTNIAKLSVQNFSAKTAEVGDLQMTDKTTGDKYCVWIDNGQLVQVKGGCATANNKTQSVALTVTTPEIQSQVQQVVQQTSNVVDQAAKAAQDATQAAQTAKQASASAQQSAQSAQQSSISQQQSALAPSKLDITSVANIKDINVDYASDISTANLPATVTVTMSDSTTQSLTATWDSGTPAYDKNTAGTYVFAGTLTVPDTITNTNNLKASVNVIVAVQPPLPPPALTDTISNAIQNASSGLLNGVFNFIKWIITTPIGKLINSQFFKQTSASLMDSVKYLKAGLLEPAKSLVH